MQFIHVICLHTRLLNEAYPIEQLTTFRQIKYCTIVLKNLGIVPVLVLTKFEYLIAMFSKY